MLMRKKKEDFEHVGFFPLFFPFFFLFFLFFGSHTSTQNPVFQNYPIRTYIHDSGFFFLKRGFLYLDWGGGGSKAWFLVGLGVDRGEGMGRREEK